METSCLVSMLAASFLVVVTVRIWWVQAFQRREAFAMS
jgi:hypothetical protein